MIIRQEKFNELNVYLRDVSAEVARSNGYSSGIWQHKGRINWQNDLVIGFSPTNFHAFLMVGATEFHPRFSFNKIKTRAMNKDSVRAAFFVVVKNLSADQIERIERLVLGLVGQRTLSCIEGVKKALQFGAGLNVPSLTSCDLYISQVIYMIMLEGITHRNGSKADLEFYTTKHISVKKMFEEITFAEKSFRHTGIFSYYFYKIFDRKDRYKPLFFTNSLADLRKQDL